MAAGLCLSGMAEEALDGERIMEIERALYACGYHNDNFNAQMDGYTRKALKSFQIANGLEATGQADEETLALLDSGTAMSSHTYLVRLAAEYVGVPILQAGGSGESVSQLQKRLKELGYFSGACDGVFGDATLSAVRRFQMANGLTQTGVADPSMQLRLSEGEPLSWQEFLDSAAVGEGDFGVRVRLLQRGLEEMGYFNGACTGVFGDLTKDAVKAFQTANGLEATGEADAQTCARLYADDAVALRMPGTLHVGDDDDYVNALQRDLAGLGYFDRNLTGIFGATTETAVRLFQMANGLPATGEADPTTLTLLESGSAVSLSEVREKFLLLVQEQGEAARDVIGGVAAQARGRSFEADYEDLYEGFAFVQYVCVAAGVPVVSPEDIVGLISEPVEDLGVLKPGDILAMRIGDSGMLRLAVCTGEGRAAYATPGGGYVLESYISEMVDGALYRWNMEAVAE